MHENMIHVKKVLVGSDDLGTPGLIDVICSGPTSADVYSYIPREDIKVLLGNLIEYFTDKESAKDVREGLDTEFDSQVTTDGVCNSYVRISYFNDGWPQEGDRQKLKQKYITWDYRSVGHSE